MTRPSSTAGNVRTLVKSGLCCALALATGSAQASPPATIADFTSRVILERRTLADGTRIVINPDPDTANFAVCVRQQGAPPATLPQNRDLALRGAEVRARDSSFCVSVPRNVPRLALDAAHGALGLPWTPAPGGNDREPADPARRTLDLVLEGLEHDAAPRRVVAIVGAESVASATSLVESTWGSSRTASSERPSRWVLHQTTPRLSVSTNEGERPRLDMGWAVPFGTTDETASFDVAAEIWAGEGGRLPRLLSGTRGMSRAVHSAFTDLPGGRILGLSVELTSRATVDRVQRFVDGSLRRLRLAVPSKAEVSRAVALLERRAFAEWEDPLRRADLLAGFELSRGDARAFLEETASLVQVTPASVRRAAFEPLDVTRRSSVETYPKSWPPDDPKLQGYVLHTAEEGDTLESLAIRYGTTVAALSRANDLDPRFKLSAGQGIWIK